MRLSEHHKDVLVELKTAKGMLCSAEFILSSETPFSVMLIVSVNADGAKHYMGELMGQVTELKGISSAE